MKKQKRFLALLLTGLLMIPASIGARAEELTSEIYYPGQTVTVDDGAAEDSLSDLTSETLPEAEAPVDETSVYEEEIEKMLAVDMAGMQVEDSALTEEKEAQIEQLKNAGGIADLTESSELDNVGVSASVSTAHSRLKSFILANGTYSTGSSESYYYVGDIVRNNMDIFTYFRYYPSSNKFDFGTMVINEEDNLTILIDVEFAYGASGNAAAQFIVGEGTSTILISSGVSFKPASYHGTETLYFSTAINRIYSNPADLQKQCNSFLQLGYKTWDNYLKQWLNETMLSVGFGKSSATPTPKPTATPTPKPTATPTPLPTVDPSVFAASITGFYNSVRGADIRWTKVPGADGYQIYRVRSAEGKKCIVTITDPNTLQYYDAEIKDNCWGRVYVYYVIPYAAGETGDYGNQVTLQRLAPMWITRCRNDAAGKAELTWACTVNENKALGYEIQYATSKEELFGQTGSFRKVPVEGRNNLSRTISGLTKGNTYYFRIRCYVNYTHSVTGKTTKTWSQYSDVVSVKITK